LATGVAHNVSAGDTTRPPTIRGRPLSSAHIVCQHDGSEAGKATAGAPAATANGVLATPDGATLHSFAKDIKPGDTTGDGKGSVWHLVKV